MAQEEKKRVLILSAGSQNRLVKEFADRDFEADVMAPDAFYCYLSDKIGYDRLYLKGNEADGKNKRIAAKTYAAIVPRISGGDFEYGQTVVKHVSENLGIFSTASEFGLGICSNKFETCQFLSRHRVRVPKQILAHNLTDFKEAIEAVGGFPFVLKLQKGSQGAGVFLVRDETEASQTLRALKYTKMDLVLSQKLDSGEPANDLRVWVIGGMAEDPKLFAYKRYALADDFRSNYSLSGSGEKATLTDEEKEMAIKSARALRMNIAGVDIMRNQPEKGKPYVIEVNGNPGLKGIEAVTGKNIAGEVAQFVIDNYQKGNKWNLNYSKSFTETEISMIEWMVKNSQEAIKGTKISDPAFPENYRRVNFYLGNIQNLISHLKAENSQFKIK